jgi:hypothetical protein
MYKYSSFREHTELTKAARGGLNGQQSQIAIRVSLFHAVEQDGHQYNCRWRTSTSSALCSLTFIQRVSESGPAIALNVCCIQTASMLELLTDVFERWTRVPLCRFYLSSLHCTKTADRDILPMKTLLNPLRIGMKKDIHHGMSLSCFIKVKHIYLYSCDLWK